VAATGIEQVQYAVVGGYTADLSGSAVGLTSYRGTAGTTGMPALEPVDTLELASPSYLVAHPSRPWLFAVSESTPSSVSSVQVHHDGSLALLSTVPSGGDAACHLALSPDLSRLGVAHYGSGSVSSVALDAGGGLRTQDVLPLRGHGPDPERQQGPHAHQVVWYGEELLVCDLGADRVHRLRLGLDGRLAEAGPAVALPAGSGPRHLVVLAGHLVVACELSGELWLAHQEEDGHWQALGSVPTSATTRGGPVHPSALVTDGSRLFVANRGPGTVAVFRLDATGGRLHRTAEFPCGGSEPRDLTLAAGHLWVANQADDRLSVFSLAFPPTGRPAFEVAVPTPTCVALLAQDKAIP